jgi:hypothetical protein
MTRAETTRRAALLALTALGGCAPKQPPDFSYTGSYDPLYYALTTAERNLSNLSEYRGRPAGAAAALAQFQFILAEFQEEAAVVSVPAAASSLIPAGDQEMRTALGIAPGAPPRAISSALRRFASLWAGGQREAALAVLARPPFTLGPQQTLAVLGALPPMRALESASFYLTRAAGTMQDVTAPLRS